VAEALSTDPIELLTSRLKNSELPEPAECKAIRDRAGVTLSEAAAVINVSPMTLWKWEQGRATPNRNNAILYRRLLEALKKAASSS
jgi:DNA-binding transcriptional regulator YiaG